MPYGNYGSDIFEFFKKGIFICQIGKIPQRIGEIPSLLDIFCVILQQKTKKYTTMKKFTFMMVAAAMMAVPALFTSCDDDPWYDDYYDYPDYYWGHGGRGGYDDYDDDDNQGATVQDEAAALQGEWDGSMSYSDASNGEVSNFYANMTFVLNSANATKGTGTEIDYTLDGNNNVADQQTLKFNWSIDESNGNINIEYLTDNHTRFVMDASASQYGFFLDSEKGTFEGYMIGSNTKDIIYINLSRVTNNNAKTRAGKSISFGKGFDAALKGGINKLTLRR